MAVPEGYKTAEQIAVEFDKPINRIRRAIRELDIVQQVFPRDRRRYYRPEDVERIREWVATHA